MRGTVIVDTHVHIASPDQARYPRIVAPHAVNWLRDMPVTAEQLLQHMRWAGIERAGLMQAFGAYAFDNAYEADSAAAFLDPFIAVCVVDVERPAALDRLTSWVKGRGVKGIRLFTSTEPEGKWLDDPRTFPVWELAERLGIRVGVQALYHHMPRLKRALERFPHVLVALDHMGAPPLSSGPPYDSAKDVFDLARFPGLHLKFSTVNLYAARQGKSTPREFFSRIVERFGPERLAWGSNFPNTYDRGLEEQLDLAREALSFLTTREQALVFGENALRLWPALRGGQPVSQGTPSGGKR